MDLPVLGSVVAVAAGYWVTCSFLIHRSYHSNGWDLGLINQIIWNSSHGRLFDYSFRATTTYEGDHWQPFLLVLAPLKWLSAGPEGLLVLQGLVLALAAIPLYASVRAVAESRVALSLAGVYLIGLGAARAVSFDFHIEAFAPLLAFTALWALTQRRPLIFTGCGLLILTLKEDAALLTLALCWVAWFAFKERASVVVLGSVALVYGYVATSVIIPHYRGADLNPFVERYGYLGDSPLEVLIGAVVHPDLVASQLVRPEALAAVALVMASASLLPLAVPRLLPPLAIVVSIPLLSKAASQSSLDFHYLLVPSTVALLLAVVAIRERVRPDGRFAVTPRLSSPRGWALAIFALPLLLFIVASPLPPSLGTEWSRYNLGHHSRVADDFVDDVPTAAIVSAQSPFVPHVSERTGIYQFPRVLDAEFVLLDEEGPIPSEDLAAGYHECLAFLPRLGFDRLRYEDGISLWRKTRPSESVPDAPPECSGQRP